MNIIASDNRPSQQLGYMLEGYECPAILVSDTYQILAINQAYKDRFGSVDINSGARCHEISHGYPAPCDQSGEDCPLSAARESGHRERVLHIHQTPRGREHVDVEMLPILDDSGTLVCFVELLHPVSDAGAEDTNQLLVGASPAFNKMLSKITRVSASDAAVLLLGESGTGKELAAGAIHRGSTRQDKALVTLECAGLTDSLFESELFGHVKGAFTGAYSNKKGLAELADGGTLFLDEIGDVPLTMQVKLLRLLETGTYRPVGSAQSKTVDFRLICATHKDIYAMVRRGEFREDLYYRINVFPIPIPSLAERREDLPLLCDALIKRLSPGRDYYLTDSAMQLLRQYAFPGNIRELRNLLNRAIVLTDTNLIESDVIAECLQADAGYRVERPPRQAWVDLKTAERHYLESLLEACDGNKERAAEIAGVSLRSLYRKLGAER